MKRGRSSVNSLSVVSIHSATRLNPPPNLSKDEAEIFRRTVASCHPSHFVLSDLPLLVAYSKAILTNEKAYDELNRCYSRDAANLWDRSTKNILSLARSMRLTPQSRMDHRAAARKQGLAPSAYDQMKDDDA